MLLRKLESKVKKKKKKNNPRKYINLDITSFEKLKTVDTRLTIHEI